MLDIKSINNITYIEKDGETFWFAEGEGKLHKLEKGGPGSGPQKGGGGKSDEENAAQSAKDAYLKRRGITSENLDAKEVERKANPRPETKLDHPEVAHAKGVLAAKELGGPVPQKDVNEAMKTLKRHDVNYERADHKSATNYMR